jgi:hypothetical protein
VSADPQAVRTRPQWRRNLLLVGAAAAVVLAIDFSGLKDRLYAVPGALAGGRLLVILLCGGLALLLLVAGRDKRRPGDWAGIAFLLVLAAVQAALLISGARNPSDLF